MVLTKIYDNIDNINDLKAFHVETAMVKSDDVSQQIMEMNMESDWRTKRIN